MNKKQGWLIKEYLGRYHLCVAAEGVLWELSQLQQENIVVTILVLRNDALAESSVHQGDRNEREALNGIQKDMLATVLSVKYEDQIVWSSFWNAYRNKTNHQQRKSSEGLLGTVKRCKRKQLLTRIRNFTWMLRKGFFLKKKKKGRTWTRKLKKQGKHQVQKKLWRKLEVETKEKKWKQKEMEKEELEE